MPTPTHPKLTMVVTLLRGDEPDARVVVTCDPDFNTGGMFVEVDKATVDGKRIDLTSNEEARAIDLAVDRYDDELRALKQNAEEERILRDYDKQLRRSD